MGENSDSGPRESSEARGSDRNEASEKSEASLEARVKSNEKSESSEHGSESKVYSSEKASSYSSRSSKSSSDKKSKNGKFRKYAAAAGLALSLYSGANNSAEASSSEGIEGKVYHSEAQHSDSKSSGKKKVQGYATAIIYHVDKKSGRKFVVLEENPAGYSFVQERNKIRPLGGTAEDYDKSRYITLEREVSEEVHEQGSSILKKNLKKNGKLLMTIRTEHPHEISETDLYEIEIKDEAEWSVFLRARWKHDAGYQRVFSDAELKAMPDDKFAYVYSGIIKGWLSHSGHGHSSGHHLSNNVLQDNSYSAVPNKAYVPSFVFDNNPKKVDLSAYRPNVPLNFNLKF